MTIEKNVMYLIGRPEVSPAGRFGRRVTTFTTAMVMDNGQVIYGSQSYTSFGKLGTPNDVVLLTKAEFQKMIKKSSEVRN